VSAGQESITYGARLDVTLDSSRVISFLLAVVVSSGISEAYNSRNLDGVKTLVDTVVAGSDALAYSTFSFTTSTDISTLQGGFVTWELLDADGRVWSSGNAIDYSIVQTGLTNRVDSTSVVTVPSDIPANIAGYRYQLRWTLTLPNANNHTVYNFENVTVTSPVSVPLGAEDSVEMSGDTATVSLVLDQAYDRVAFEVYAQNGSVKLVSEQIVTDVGPTADGFYCNGYIDTQALQSVLPPALEPYTVLWNFRNQQRASRVLRHTGRLFIANVSLLSAVDDMRLRVAKSQVATGADTQIIFTPQLLLSYLRRGRDFFNGAYGMMTNFTMLNATGPVREYWLMCAEIQALRAQFLAEGERVFNFSGASISLDTDRTQYYSQLADNLQSILDNEFKAFKTVLSKRGLIGGDGNVDPTSFAPGAVGNVGLGLTPASGFGTMGKFMGNFNGGIQ
jgi:hypothetical protein